MTAIFEGVASNFIFDLLKDGATKISKAECIRKFKRKHHFPIPSQNDFFILYQDAIIEFWYLEKPEEVVGFFKNESICQAFYDLHYHPEKDFWQAIHHAIESLKVGDEIKKVNADIHKEIEAFKQIFIDLINQSRNLKEIEDSRKLDELLRRSSLEKRSQKASKSLTLLPPLPITFIGRQDKLDELDEFLKKGKNATLINGIGGMGKTTIAQQYVNLPEYTKRLKHLAWVSLNTGLQDDILKELHNRDGLFCYDQNQTADENYQRLLVLLQNLDGPNLLVLDDNLNQTDIFDGFGINNWQVLVCSRTNPEGFHKIDVDELSVSDARDLFYAHYYKNRNDELVDRIVQTVARHTLTVELLAKIAHSNASLTLEIILAGLAEKGLSFDDGTKIHSPYDKARNKKYINDCLDAAFNLAEIENNSDQELIKFVLWFSVMPSDFISFEMLCEIFSIKDKEQTAFSNQLNALSDLGWITCNQQSYKMHSVVQDIVRRKLKPDVENCFPIIDSLKWKLKTEPDENPLDKSKYIPYSYSLFMNITVLNKDMAVLANFLSYIYKSIGNLSSAFEYSNKSIAFFKKNPTNSHSDLAATYNNLSLIYQDKGDLREALKFQLIAIEFCKKVLNPNHPTLGTAYNNLSGIYRGMGNMSQAAFYMLKAIEIYKKTLDFNHPFLATSFNNLSLIHQNLGNLPQAIEFQLKALEIREKTLSPDHPDLAASYNNLSLIYLDKGNCPQALKFQLKAIEINQKVLAPDHPNLAASYSNLSTIYQDKGNLPFAFKFQMKAIEIRKKILAPDHPDMAASYNNISRVYYEMGNIQQALRFQLKANKIYEKNFNTDHPALAHSYNNLCSIYFDMKDLTNAKFYNDKAIEIYKKSLPNEHPAIKEAMDWQQLVGEALRKTTTQL